MVDSSGKGPITASCVYVLRSGSPHAIRQRVAQRGGFSSPGCRHIVHRSPVVVLPNLHRCNCGSLAHRLHGRRDGTLLATPRYDRRWLDPGVPLNAARDQRVAPRLMPVGFVQATQSALAAASLSGSRAALKWRSTLLAASFDYCSSSNLT